MKKLILCMLPMMMLAAACQNKSGEKVPAIDLGNLDTSVAPGDDFYKYATHGWQVANPLGAEYSRFGTFDQLRENNVTRLNDLFASMADMETKKGSIEQKIVDLYKQGLDSTRLNTEGAAPLQKYIAEIQADQDPPAGRPAHRPSQPLCLNERIRKGLFRGPRETSSRWRRRPFRGLCRSRPDGQRQPDPLHQSGRSWNRRP